MVFTAVTIKTALAPKPKKAKFPFEHMRDNPGTGFVIPAELEDEMFAYARVMTSLFNKANGTNFRCNKLPDGSLRVWNEKQGEELLEMVETLTASVKIAEQRKIQKATAKEQQPTKQQFTDWINNSLQPGMSYTFQVEYAHRFDEFKQWCAEIGCETETKFNPPSLKISRKAVAMKEESKPVPPWYKGKE